MKRMLKAVIGGVTLCLLLSLCGFGGECREIRERVVRLHILANSDSEADQALKLRVRDAVVEAADGLLDGTETMEEAKTEIRAQLPRLEQVAQETVYANGYTYPVTATLCEMYFETRVYDTVTMPAGVYDAVRFTIGAGQGKNWWCVIYPPMCVQAAVKEQSLSEVLDSRQMHIVTGEDGFAVRFKIVEIFEWLLHKQSRAAAPVACSCKATGATSPALRR